jgi:two-component system, sensor histidine kinase
VLLWPAVDPRAIVGWVLAKIAVTVWRAWLTRRFDAERPAGTLRRGRQFEWALAADGAVFGALGWLLLPQDDMVMSVVMVATLLGIAAIGLVVLSMNQRACLALVVPTLLPGMVWQLAQANPISLYVGAGMGVFLALAVIEGRGADGHMRELLRLRFSTGALAEQRQQALLQAERSNAVKSQFLAVMSHEMRTPLHGILGLARVLRDEAGFAAGRARERLTTLERTGQHLLTIINDVLDYSRIEGRHLRIHAAPFDLQALVDAVAELTRVSAAERGLTVELRSTLPQACWVLGDAARLRQVLLNLTGNAVKFTEVGGVVLQARWAAGQATIVVTDSGPGIAPEDRERIFHAFEQLDGGFARRHGGTGLGLTISRELVEAMQGTVECSAAAGGGAAFSVHLPLPAAPAVAEAPTSPMPLGPLQGRVLLAEDNPVNAIVAETVLQRIGLEVTTVTDGELAVVQARSGGWDLVLMDCQMPGVDGFEATQRIRAEERQRGRPRVPIVALTANALEGDRERSLAAGMDDHLAKPFNEPQLRAALQRWFSV